MFILHLDVMTTDKNTHRVTLSNLSKSATTTKKNARSIHFALKGSHKWSVWAIDMAVALRERTPSPFECLKGVQMCAGMMVRGLYTSDVKFSLETLPRDMSMSQALEPGLFDLLWFPKEPEDVGELFGRRPKNTNNSKNTKMPSIKKKLGEQPPKKNRAAPKDVNPSPVVPKNVESPTKQGASPLRELQNVFPDTPNSLTNSHRQHSEVDEKTVEPQMSVFRVCGFTGEYTNMMVWIPGSDNIAFAASSVVVIITGDGSVQRQLFGHSAPICAICVDGSGGILATGQEGQEAIIRIWDLETKECMAMLKGHASGLISMDLSLDGEHLVAVGLDAQHRQSIITWNIKDIRKGEGDALMEIQQTSDFNIKHIKWSAFDDDKLLSCGRDSIRIYRVKENQLRGMSIKLGSPEKRVRKIPGGGSASIGNQIFTCMAFEVVSNPLQKERHVYVGSASGAVFQINYEQRRLDCIYQLHNGAINCMSISEGFCAMGSDDDFLRVWPLDFSDYFLEAKNEASVTSMGLSPDGLKIAVGTESGAIGALDIATHCHSTLLRSHTDTINCVAISPKGSPEICTASMDGSVRVWSIPTCSQQCQFAADGEKAFTVAYHPHGAVLAAGFNKGKIRVFDVAGTMLIQECVQHRGDVRWVEFSTTGDRLFSMGSDGNLCMYDTTHDYRPIKYTAVSEPSPHVCMAISSDSKWLAVTAHKNATPRASILIFHAEGLDPCLKIETLTDAFSRLAFTPDSRQLWGIDVKSPSIIRFDVESGGNLGALTNIHSEGCGAMEIDPSLKYVWTGGGDGVVKMWDYSSEIADSSPFGEPQSFTGHPDIITDIKLLGDYVISVGYGNAIIVWKVDIGYPHSMALAIPKDRAENLPKTPAPTLALAQMHDQREPSPNNVPEMGARSAASHPKLPAAVSRRLECDSILGVSGEVPDSVVWDADTGFFAYSADNIVVVEHLQSRKQTFLSNHSQQVCGLALAPGGSLLASGSQGVEASRSADIYIWDTASRRRVAVLEYHPCSVQALAFSPDACWLVSLGAAPERSVVIWDVVSGEAIAVGRTREHLTAVAWCPASDRPEFVTVGGEGALIWTLESTHLCQRSMVLPVEAIEAGCCCVCCDSLGRILIGDGRGTVWSLSITTGGGSLSHKAIELEAAVMSIFVCGARLAVGTADGTLGLYRGSANDSWLLENIVKLNGGVTSLSFDACIREGVVGTDGGVIWYVNVDEKSKSALVSGHPCKVRSMSAAAHDPDVLATTSEDGVLRIWSVDKGTVTMEVKSSQKCTSVCFSLCGEICAAGYNDGTLRLFDVEKAAVRWTLLRHSSSVVGLGVDAEGKKLLSMSADGVVYITEIATGKLLGQNDGFQGGSPPLSSISMSRNGNVCAGAWPHKLVVFNVPWSDAQFSSKAICKKFDPTTQDGGASSAFSSSEPHIVLYTNATLDGRILFFDTRTSRVKRSVHLPTGFVSSLAVSMNGVWLAAGSQGGAVFMVEYSSGEWRELPGHRRPVNAIQFSHCNTSLMSGGGNFLMVWNVRDM
ncbi:hypothetical protein BSKO_05231 [Bryopsis sp. KO-2023]|nr:hypothetical protein BSKO_05231 [Bryopsis sp. KO-2023]